MQNPYNEIPLENKETAPEKVYSDLSKEQLAQIELQNKKKYAVDKLKEIKNLWTYLMNVHTKNRHGRKQFRRDFISDDRFSQDLINTVIDFYESGAKQAN